MAASRKIRLVGGTIYVRGKRAWAHVPLGWGNGRRRQTAPSTPQGIEELSAWIASEVSAAATSSRTLSAAELTDARAALEILPSGMSLVDAAAAARAMTSAGLADARTAREILPAGMSLVEAARLAAETAKVAVERKIGDAAAEYLKFAERSGRRPDTLGTIRTKLGYLRHWWGDNVSSFSPALAAEIVASRPAATTQNTTRTTLAAFFKWCTMMGYCAGNPFSQVPPSIVDEKMPRIYTPADVAKLFRKAETTPLFRPLVPFLAVAFFAGIRSSGIFRLSGKAFDFEAGLLSIPPPADKKRRGYYAPMIPTLRAWLEAYPVGSGPVASKNSSMVYRQIRELHATAGVERIANGMRHSFGSYSVAAGGNPPAVALAMGHFGDTTVLFNHYRALTTPSAAAAFFAIRPTAAGKKI
jgi:integrase